MSAAHVVTASALHRRKQSLSAMFAAGLLFAVMGATTKATHVAGLVGRPIPSSEVVVVRFACGILAMLPLQLSGRVNLLGSNRRGLLLRGIWGGFAVFFYFLSLQKTSLNHAQLLNYSSIVFAPLFAWKLLGEKFDRPTGMALLLAIAGIAFLTIPGLFNPGASIAGDLYGLLSGILAGAAVTEIRRLRRSETAWSVFFYLCLIGMPIALVGCLTQGVVWPTSAGWLVLLFMGISSVTSQILMTFGYKYVSAAQGTLIMMSQLAYNAVAGVYLFGEHISGMTAVGASMILLAAYWQSRPRTQNDQILEPDA